MESQIRPRFSISVLLLVTALVAVSLGWLVDRQHYLQRRNEAYQAAFDAKRRALTKRVELELQRAENYRLSRLLNESD